ncbi:hypothetical protein CLG85_001535 [Yangia mangrovi]|uniref:Uncharacterized protein n=1 Tax=Alloyangia mangrovi TaxID=1779329 RepID=A0A2A3K0U3_9RHOB|nr:hypothetical protein [Alloyangia mangrovi]MCT4369091.1 hypothetical protein [Alloyangia mangrovi]
MSGTVNISRSLWEDEAFAADPFSEREAWIWMIAEASWKPRKRRVGDYIVPLERGQLAGSIRFFAKAWKWTPAKAQRFLDRIQKMDLIRRETDTGVTVVTICKYDEYQYGAKAPDAPPIQDRYTSDTNEKKGERKGKEGKEDTNVSLPPAGADLHPANDLSHAVGRYNAAAEKAGWPQVQKLNPNRSKLLRARLKDCGGVEGWEVALRKAFDSDFLRGRTSAGFVLSFDFLIKAANFTKLMEGNYDNRSGNFGHQAARPGGQGSSLFDACAAVAARRSGRA